MRSKNVSYYSYYPTFWKQCQDLAQAYVRLCEAYSFREHFLNEYLPLEQQPQKSTILLKLKRTTHYTHI